MNRYVRLELTLEDRSMAQYYSDPSRENETYALPDLEVWEERISVVRCSCGDYELPHDTAFEYVGDALACPSCGRESDSVTDTDRYGWWYWYCVPGCIPDSDPMGPFATEAEALADAREGVESD